MNWGTKIAILYAGFVALIGSMVFISMNQKVDLVAKDYYQQELNYQTRIDAINNAKILNEEIAFQVEGKKVTLNFPEEISDKLNGEVNFYCPANSSNDFKVKLQSDKKGQQIISNEKLIHGMYKMQISWTADNKDYYTEKAITIE